MTQEQSCAPSLPIFAGWEAIEMDALVGALNLDDDPGTRESQDDAGVGAEEWRPVVGWEGLYEVSSLGRIRGVERPKMIVRCGQEYSYTIPAMIRKPFIGRGGATLLVTLTDSTGRARHLHVVEVVSAAFGINRRPEEVYSYRNGNRQDCAVANISVERLSAVGETWKPVVGWEGEYEVSDYGRVRSAEGHTWWRAPNGQTVPRKRRTRIMKPALDRRFGYPFVVLQRPGKIARPKVHVLVCKAFHGPRPSGYHCRHLNGDPADPRASNLMWGTPKENERDKIIHGFAKLAGLTLDVVKQMLGEESGDFNFND